jgi:hypothetical protein
LGWPALSQREKVVDPEALCLMGRLAFRVRARVHPGVLDVKARRISVEDQVPPIASVLQWAIRDEGQLTLEHRHRLLPSATSSNLEGKGLAAGCPCTG